MRVNNKWIITIMIYLIKIKFIEKYLEDKIKEI